MPDKRFYRRRMGPLEHLKIGTISLFDDGLHDFICMNAQHQLGNGSSVPPGVWVGSAQKIWLETGRQDPERKIRRSLEKLDRLGWLKRFHQQGRTGDYPILIARLVVRDQDGNDFWINAEATTDWRNPILVPHDTPRREASVKRPGRDREASGYLIDSICVDGNTLPIEAFLDYWNQHCGPLPKLLTFSEARKKKLQARIESNPNFMQDLQKALLLAGESNFLSGRVKDWKANADWFLENNKNIGKVLEGNYSNSNMEGKNVNRPSLTEKNLANRQQFLRDAQ